jgi:predicted Rossmann fold nucleotide-binding protein DprA/Smf involved in DNA uptake
LSAKDKNSVAMVGSRMTTHYGIETARKLAYQLAYLGVTVVSGGARGIDTAAHQGALTGNGHAIAVLGTGDSVPDYERFNDSFVVVFACIPRAGA